MTTKQPLFIYLSKEQRKVLKKWVKKINKETKNMSIIEFFDWYKCKIYGK
jgi:hypothetical protein